MFFLRVCDDYNVNRRFPLAKKRNYFVGEYLAMLNVGL